ncbi:hypothetical protein L7E35_004910 [Vibrio parahaemolyticus]|nr:hypothetical protein [Vibrio parahaemolyticus]EIV1599947.1 hypothetical protein [Vibrio parahaemolyticus]
MKNTPNKHTENVSPEALRKRQERERKRNAGMVDKTVTLSQARQAQLDEVLDYMGVDSFQRLAILLLDAQYQKVVAHKQRHQCCGKCGDPYRPGGSCVFEGDYRCQYTHQGQRHKELLP